MNIYIYIYIYIYIHDIMLILNICLSHENLGCIPLCKKSEFLNRWIQIIVFFVLYNFGNKKMLLDYFTVKFLVIGTMCS